MKTVRFHSCNVTSVVTPESQFCTCVQDYLTLEDPTQIYNMASIDMAFTVAYNLTRDFTMRTFNLTEDQAITAITTVMDFAVTQVVDGEPIPA